jgi:hypothetical protein
MFNSYATLIHKKGYVFEIDFRIYYFALKQHFLQSSQVQANTKAGQGYQPIG